VDLTVGKDFFLPKAAFLGEGSKLAIRANFFNVLNILNLAPLIPATSATDIVNTGTFGRAPEGLAADPGFFSAANESKAEQMGVKRVSIPSHDTKSPARKQRQKQRWFKNLQKWRTGCEGRISVLKRRHGLRRSLYKRPDGIRRWVGLGVIADNIIHIGTHLAELTWRWRNELASELTRWLAPGDPIGFTAALAAGTTMNIIEIVVQTWVDNPAVTDAKGLAREAMRLLRGGGIPLPTAKTER